MFALLHQYLVENRKLFLQGIGLLQIMPQPAAYDVANQCLTPPKQITVLNAVASPGSLQPLMAFISRQLDISEENAFTVYHDFCEQLKKDLEEKKEVDWQPVGIFKKNGDGNYLFEQVAALDVYHEPVSAVRVIRQGASHTMMVGTTETTSTAMKELLEEQPAPAPKSRWWIAASLLGLVAVALIVLKKMEIM